MPGAALPVAASSAAWATSSTCTGWNFVFAPHLRPRISSQSAAQEEMSAAVENTGAGGVPDDIAVSGRVRFSQALDEAEDGQNEDEMSQSVADRRGDSPSVLEVGVLGDASLSLEDRINQALAARVEQ